MGLRELPGLHLCRTPCRLNFSLHRCVDQRWSHLRLPLLSIVSAHTAKPPRGEYSRGYRAVAVGMQGQRWSEERLSAEAMARLCLPSTADKAKDTEEWGHQRDIIQCRSQTAWTRLGLPRCGVIPRSLQKEGFRCVFVGRGFITRVPSFHGCNQGAPPLYNQRAYAHHHHTNNNINSNNNNNDNGNQNDESNCTNSHSNSGRDADNDDAERRWRLAEDLYQDEPLTLLHEKPSTMSITRNYSLSTTSGSFADMLPPKRQPISDRMAGKLPLQWAEPSEEEHRSTQDVSMWSAPNQGDAIPNDGPPHHGAGAQEEGLNPLRTSLVLTEDDGEDDGDADVVLDTPDALLEALRSTSRSSTQASTRINENHSIRHTAENSNSEPTTTTVLSDTLRQMCRGLTEEEEEKQIQNDGDHSEMLRGVSRDVVDLVTDAFREQREQVVEQRRRVLYELTHPKPSDYTYGNKLVPPPPFSFGRITEEAMQLAEEILVKPTYQLVFQAGTRASSNRVGPALDGPSFLPTTSHVETSVCHSASPRRLRTTSSSTGSSSRLSRRHSPSLQENVFADHSYFFEISELYQEIVVVGRASAGKSTLINALLAQPDMARTSSTPHTTRTINFYQSATKEEMRAFCAKERHNLVKLPAGGLQLTFVDVPGYGLEGMSERWRDAAIELMDSYFGVRRSVNTVLFCIDCEKGLTKTDIKYFEWLENVQGVFYVVLTKCDTVPHSRICSVMRQIYQLITKNRRKYRKVFPFILPTSSATGENIDVLRGLITETSGMIPGDRLRATLEAKKAAWMQTALQEESLRLEAAYDANREDAKKFFMQYYNVQRDSPCSAPPLGGVTEEAVEPARLSLSDGVSTAVACSQHTEKETNTTTTTDKPQGGERSCSLSSSSSLLLSGPSREDNNNNNNNNNLNSAVTDSASRPLLPPPHEMDREAFLTWRQAHPHAQHQLPYGGRTIHLNAGVDAPMHHQWSDDPLPTILQSMNRGEAPQQCHNSGTVEGLDAVHSHRAEVSCANSGVAVHTTSTPSSSFRVLGLNTITAADHATAEPQQRLSSAGAGGATMHTRPSAHGPVSTFLSHVERFQQQQQSSTAKSKRKKRGLSAAQSEQTTDDRRDGGGFFHKSGGTPGGKGPGSAAFYAEEADGRLVAFTAGKRSGPSLVSLDSDVKSRRAAWQGKQLAALLCRENREAPWRAMDTLRQKVEEAKQMAALGQMPRKDAAAYLRNAGKLTESFEKFEGEVTATKYMTESRRAPTLRSQQQMHLNATAKINYRSMPPGLWKHYGSTNPDLPPSSSTLGPDPGGSFRRVQGRLADETHRETTVSRMEKAMEQRHAAADAAKQQQQQQQQRLHRHRSGRQWKRKANQHKTLSGRTPSSPSTTRIQEEHQHKKKRLV